MGEGEGDVWSGALSPWVARGAMVCVFVSLSHTSSTFPAMSCVYVRLCVCVCVCVCVWRASDVGRLVPQLRQWKEEGLAGSGPQSAGYSEAQRRQLLRKRLLRFTTRERRREGTMTRLELNGALRSLRLNVEVRECSVCGVPVSCVCVGFLVV